MMDDALPLLAEDEIVADDRRGQKAESAYRTISEVAADLNLPQHVLRFWESKFKQISPLKRGGGRRYYRPQDIGLIKRIHYLLHTQGYTIKGVQKLLAKDKYLEQSVPTLLNDNLARVTVDEALQRVEPPVSYTLHTADSSRAASVATTDMHLLLQRLKDLRGQLNGRC